MGGAHGEFANSREVPMSVRFNWMVLAVCALITAFTTALVHAQALNSIQSVQASVQGGLEVDDGY